MASSDGSGSSASDHAGGQVDAGLKGQCVHVEVVHSQIGRLEANPGHVLAEPELEILEAGLLQCRELELQRVARRHAERRGGDTKADPFKRVCDGHGYVVVSQWGNGKPCLWSFML